jgi:hypothetical protein
MNCAEALAEIGETWDLARRCWVTLDRLMEVEGLKSDFGGGVKRKRGIEEKGEAEERKTSSVWPGLDPESDVDFMKSGASWPASASVANAFDADFLSVSRWFSDTDVANEVMDFGQSFSGTL